MFLALNEIAFILFAVFKIEFSEALLDIVFPGTFVYVTVSIAISALVAFVVAEAAVVAAKEAGLDGAASEQFINGFEGADIKDCNPRKLGLLAEFKAGVAARKEHAKAIDAATRRAYFASLNQSKSRSFDVESSGLPSNLR